MFVTHPYIKRTAHGRTASDELLFHLRQQICHEVREAFYLKQLVAVNKLEFLPEELLRKIVTIAAKSDKDDKCLIREISRFRHIARPSLRLFPTYFGLPLFGRACPKSLCAD